MPSLERNFACATFKLIFITKNNGDLAEHKGAEFHFYFEVVMKSS